MGIYNLLNQVEEMVYELNENYPEDVSEHIFFNSKFKNLQILDTWNIPAPPEHLEFKILNLKVSLNIFLKLFFDFTKR